MAPFHLQYELSRRQRLIPHLDIWARYPGLFIMLGASVVAACILSLWLLPLVAGSLWLLRGFFVGLIDVAIWPRRPMDVVVEEKGIGFLGGGERWWVSLDGLLAVRKICPDVWTVFHHNGTVINIPTSVISEEQVTHLQIRVST